MDLQDLITEIQRLQLQELDQLKESIALREQELSRRTMSANAETIAAQLDQFLDEFWQDTSDAEQAEILEAIRVKNIHG